MYVNSAVHIRVPNKLAVHLDRNVTCSRPGLIVDELKQRSLGCRRDKQSSDGVQNESSGHGSYS